MAVESGNYIDDLVITNPLSSDLVSEGDDQLRLIKKVVKQSFPSVDSAVHAIHPGAEPTTSVTAGLVWFDTAANVLKIRNEDNDAWITLAVSIITDNSVDVNAGTIDGATIGASSASTAVVSSLNVNADGATVTGIKDEDTMSSDSAVKLATQQSIKAYVDSKVTAEDLDFQGDSGTGAVDLDSQTLDIAGGSGITTTAGSQTLTVAGDDATTSAKGVASFSSDHFSVSSGAVTIATDGIDDTLIDFGTGTNQVSTADVPEQTNLYYTDVRADARIAAADIDDLSNVSITSIADDEILRYDSGSGTWQNVISETPDQLSTKGDLLAYNTGPPAAEEAFSMPAGANDKVLTANSSATYGFNWVKIATASIADDAVGADQLANTAVTANTYAYPSAIVVDAQGRLTSATAGSAGTTAGFAVAMAIAL